MPDDLFGPLGPPNPEDIPSAYPGIAAHVRFALTGDSQSTTPTGPVIDYVIEQALLDIRQANPCTAQLDGDDLLFFNRAVGYYVALALLNTPAAAAYARTLVKVKIGPVEETVSDGVVIDTARGWLEKEYQKALGSIQCVADGRVKASESGGGFGLRLAGRRRALEANCRSQSPLYNGNTGGY